MYSTDYHVSYILEKDNSVWRRDNIPTVSHSKKIIFKKFRTDGNESSSLNR